MCAGLRTDRAVGWMAVSTVFTSTEPWRSNGPEQRTRAPTPVWPTASWAQLRTRSAWRSKVRHTLTHSHIWGILFWLSIPSMSEILIWHHSKPCHMTPCAASMCHKQLQRVYEGFYMELCVKDEICEIWNDFLFLCQAAWTPWLHLMCL